MSDVWFIRHGESTTNAGEISQDRHSTRLTALGEEQAAAVSLKIPRAPDLIIVTPYIRTHLTAAPLRARFPASPVEEWPLHEFAALGDHNYTNRTWTERVPLMKEFWERNDPDYVDGAGAESFSGMTQRILTGFDRLKQRQENFTVLFAHGYILQMVRLLLARPQLPMKELMRQMYHSTRHSHIENCSIIRVHKKAEGLRLSDEDLHALTSEQAVERAD